MRASVKKAGGALEGGTRVEALLRFEIEAGKHKPAPRTDGGAVLADPSAAMGLTWLYRSLAFTSSIMQGFAAGSVRVKSVRSSYEV